MDPLLNQAQKAVTCQDDQYHVNELAIGLDPSNPRHIAPVFRVGDRVLDIGCGAGQTLISACAYRQPGEGGLCVTCSRSDCPTWGYGIDIDESALRLGKAWSKRMVLKTGAAEHLPFEDQEFDVVISRVTLIYADMGKTLTEIRRVLRPGGRIWFTLHTFGFMTAAAGKKSWKEKIFLAYAALNGLWFHLTLRTFTFRGKRDYWQTASAMRRILTRHGFRDIAIERSDSRFTVEGHL